MDWEKYGDHSELFKYMEKCTDLINGYAEIEKKRTLAEKINYEADKFLYTDKSFWNALYNAKGGPSHDYKVTFMNETGIFQVAFTIISKMSQEDYTEALRNIDNRSKDPNKSIYSKDIAFSPLPNCVVRDRITPVQEYPKTIEQFKAEGIEFLVSRGITIDMAEAAKQKSLTEGLKDMLSAVKKAFKHEWGFNYSLHKLRVDKKAGRDIG